MGSQTSEGYQRQEPQPTKTRERWLDLTPDQLLELVRISERASVGERSALRTFSGMPTTARALRAGVTATGKVRLVVFDPGFKEMPPNTLCVQGELQVSTYTTHCPLCNDRIVDTVEVYWCARPGCTFRKMRMVETEQGK